MSNLNWSNIFSNFASAMNNNVASFVNRNANLLGAKPTMYNPPQNQNMQQQTPLPLTTEQLAKTTAELASLDSKQTINMLKELLQMPKNFEQLITQLVNTGNEQNQKLALLLLASNLDISKLSSLLQSNSKQAMSNLYQMLAQFNQVGMSLKDEQTSQLAKLISFVAASSTSDVQTIKTTMLMYLPWLPLTDPNAFKLEITTSGSDGGQSSDDSVTLLISTENFGNLQVDVYKTQEDGIKVQLISSEFFPIKEFLNYLDDESRKYNININIDYATKEIFNKNKNDKTQIQVFINASPGVNPFLLLISNAIIKDVHLIDNKENLREQRKEKLSDG